MSSILALHAATTGRFDNKPGARFGSRKRTVTIQPGKKSRLVFLTEPEGLAVEQGRVRFDDASVRPPARLRVGPIALTANDVTWPGRQPARVKFSASTPEAGTLRS